MVVRKSPKPKFYGSRQRAAIVMASDEHARDRVMRFAATTRATMKSPAPRDLVVACTPKRLVSRDF
jgi:hypothetical protein